MRVSYQRNFNEIERIVTHTEQFFARNGLKPRYRMAVDLGIEELFVNMVTYNTETVRDIELEMSVVPDGIQVSLSDFEVQRFDPTTAAVPEVDAPLAERSPGGLGLFLVMKMVDSIEYHYSNRTSRVTFLIRTGNTDV